MGLSCQHILVGAPARQAADALADVDAGYVVPLLDNTCAVLLDEHAHGYDVDPFAARLSRDLGVDTLTALVHDSDVFAVTVFRAGEEVHEYLSHPDYMREIAPDEDGVLRFQDDGSRFDPDGHGTPPLGADPAWFLPFGVPGADRDAVAAALADRAADPEDALPSGRHIFAERIHGDLLAALGLPRRLAGEPYALFFLATQADEPDDPSLPATFLAMRSARHRRVAEMRAFYADAIPLGRSAPLTPSAPTEGTTWER